MCWAELLPRHWRRGAANSYLDGIGMEIRNEHALPNVLQPYQRGHLQ